VPRISWAFNIRTPSITLADAESIVLGDLYIRHADEILSNYTYPASEAGLNFAIQRSDNGVILTIDGYSDKAQELFLDLLRTLKDSKPREQKFRIYKELQQRDYQNMGLESPLVQAREVLLDLLYKDFPSSRDKAGAIKKVSFDAFSDFSNQIFARTFIEGVMYGNIDESESKDLINSLITVLNSASYPKEEHPLKEVIDLSDTNGPFYMEIKSKVKGNAAALAVAMAPFSLEMRAAQQILMQAIKEPFFTSLRTKQQTGYLVMSQGDDLEQHLFDFFAVQSNTHDSRDLLSRFEQFLEGFIQEINKGGVSKERFENIKQALLVEMKQPPLNISDMNALLYKLAFLYRGDFDWIAKKIRSFETLTYEQFLTIAKETFGKGNKRRLAVLFSGSIPHDGGLQYNRLSGSSHLREKASYSPSLLEQHDGK
jgi:insulysin